MHYVDPSLDGSCVACVGARRIYCVDGGREDENGETIGKRYDEDGNYIDDSALLYDWSLGSCQPSWAYCTMVQHKDVRSGHMYYRECPYTPVRQPGGEDFTEDMIEIEITEEMA